MTEDTSTTSKVCPECGISLSGLDVSAHSLTHWPAFLDPAKSDKEARKYQLMLANGGVTKAKYQELHKED